jgi:tungsten cofactor oxidoreducase radical SAM maturase
MKKYRIASGERFAVYEVGGDLLLRKVPHDDLRQLYVEPTTECNLNCKICVRRSWEDPIGRMSLDDYKRLMNMASSFPDLNRVVFGGFGEPLCHPEICEMILTTRKILGEDISIELTTNASLLDEATSKKMVSSGLDKLVVSFDSVSPILYEEIRIGAEFTKVTANILALGEVKRSLGSSTPSVAIEFVLMRRNMRDLPELPRLASRIGASAILVTNLLPHTADMREEILYSDPLQNDLLSDLRLRLVREAMKYPVGLILPETGLRTQRGCRFIENDSCVVSWDGHVSPCYRLMHTYPCYVMGRIKKIVKASFGNLGEGSLEEMWNNEEYVRFRHRVRMFRFPSCTDCSFGDHCWWTETSERDCWGGSPSCADCLWSRGILLCP